MFGGPVGQSRQRVGACQDNVQPQVQLSPDDPFWRIVDFEPIDPGRSGCGHSMTAFRDIVPLGGWSEEQVSLAYRDLGAGRVWLVESDWQDSNGGELTQLSRDIMGAMISGR